MVVQREEVEGRNLYEQNTKRRREKVEQCRDSRQKDSRMSKAEVD